MLTINVEKTVHKGVILNVSSKGFDSGAAALGTIFVDKDDPSRTYLFYTGAADTHWSHTSIGLAVSSDGKKFIKAKELNPVIENQKTSFCSKEVRTPVVTRLGNRFYMILAGRRSFGRGRRIGIAWADDPRGPWRIIRELIRPKESWEGNDIDLGPCVARTSETELIVYYSNVTNKWPLSLLFGPRFLLRRIGLLKLKINSPSSIEACRYEGNPLKHLNGPRGSWNESLFCPGYLEARGAHYLFPAASTYSIGLPCKQYIGMVADSTPYFHRSHQFSVLVNGPTEKSEIVPAIRSEIALDTPYPVVKGGKLMLYYSVMDRADNIWKTALTIFSIE